MAKKILVVDDEPDMMEIATVRLKHLGYQIISAIDAEMALEILKNETPDLILLDLLLPKMQGDELCKQLKAQERYKNIPVILFTASAVRPNLPGMLVEMGADDCVTKPFEPQELLGKIQRLIK